MVQDSHFVPVTPSDACTRTEETLRLLDSLTSRWHIGPVPDSGLDLVCALHWANFELWHLEDQARDPLASDAQIASSKRAIDRVNQRRNDIAESIDEALLALAPDVESDVPLHSETPGQMLDRLSILALKLFHTAEEMERSETTEAHRHRNRERFLVLKQQQFDLAGCLKDLWLQVLSGERRFKRYRQLKMYNDPELNPVLYRAAMQKSTD